MKRRLLFNFRYPKIALFIIAIIGAYFMFGNNYVQNYVSHLGNFGYVGIFIAGLFFSFGFTTPFSTGFFLTVNPGNIYLAAMLGGIGALIADLLIFSFIRLSFMDEFKRIENTKLSKKTGEFIKKSIGKKAKFYLMYAFAGIIIASPLPDEAGVTLLAGLTHIKISALAKISLLMNTLGILILLWI
jgi:hypothetical protein